MPISTRTAERRRDTRHPVAGTFRVLWENADGQTQVCMASLVDVSTKGMKILVDKQMATQTYVTINDQTHGIMGRGSVRYCRYQKGKYAVGLEFQGGTGWKPPAAS